MSDPNHASPKPDSADDSAKILVIEDNLDDQEVLVRQLHKSGVDDKVMCIGNGTDALNLLRDGARKLAAVAAVFLDLSLPGVNGLMLLQAIRSNVETALLPVFILTGSTNPKDEDECRRLGATSFIPKRQLSSPAFRPVISEMMEKASKAHQEKIPT